MPTLTQALAASYEKKVFSPSRTNEPSVIVWETDEVGYIVYTAERSKENITPTGSVSIHKTLENVMVDISGSFGINDACRWYPADMIRKMFVVAQVSDAAKEIIREKLFGEIAEINSAGVKFYHVNIRHHEDRYIEEEGGNITVFFMDMESYGQDIAHLVLIEEQLDIMSKQLMTREEADERARLLREKIAEIEAESTGLDDHPF